jgi:hypothetical protein
MRSQLRVVEAAFPTGANRDMVAACLAGLWLAFDFLDESHTISQDLHTAEGSYWHALIHRREPDHSNAAYWFRHVGHHPIFASLNQAVAELAVSAPSQAAFLARQTIWDPFAFNKLCEISHEETAPCNQLCQQLQRIEWELLFAYCCERALGS